MAPCWSLMMRTERRLVPSRSLVLRLAQSNLPRSRRASEAVHAARGHTAVIWMDPEKALPRRVRSYFPAPMRSRGPGVRFVDDGLPAVSLPLPDRGPEGALFRRSAQLGPVTKQLPSSTE